MEKREMTEVRRKLWEARADTVLQKPGSQAREKLDTQIENLLFREEELSKRPENQPYPVPQYNSLQEKWIDLDGTKSIYLKLTFGSTNQPITEVNFFNISTKDETKVVRSPMTLMFLANPNEV